MNTNVNAVLCLLLITSCSISIAADKPFVINSAQIELNSLGNKKTTSKPNYGSITPSASAAVTEPIHVAVRRSSVRFGCCKGYAIGFTIVGLYAALGFWAGANEPVHHCQDLTISQCGPCGQSVARCMPLGYSHGATAREVAELDYIHSHCSNAQISGEPVQCLARCKGLSALKYLESCSQDKKPHNSTAQKLRDKIKALQDQRRSRS